MTNLFGVPTMTFGNVSDVLLKSQQLTNQYNTKELPYYFLLPTIEINVSKAYNNFVKGIMNCELGTSCELAPAGGG